VAARAAATGREPAEIERQLSGANSIGKLVDAEEVAWVVAFLASPRSVAITGDAIVCGGGQRGAIHY
jgi:NAD(P)-dependent dehydrogenase (short-subunit alcohol dehydrogenase family)